MSELKHCPLSLCAGVARYVQPPMGDPSYICCTKCGMRLSSCMIDLKHNTLLEFWNTRPAQAIPETVEIAFTCEKSKRRFGFRNEDELITAFLVASAAQAEAIKALEACQVVLANMDDDANYCSSNDYLNAVAFVSAALKEGR